MLTVFGAVLAAAADLWRSAGHLLIAPSGTTGLAVAALTVAVLAAALSAWLADGGRLGRLSAAIPLISRSEALREKSWNAAFLRQRDPDAAGRARPRAPSAALAAAAT